MYFKKFTIHSKLCNYDTGKGTPEVPLPPLGAWRCNIELSPQRCPQVHQAALLQPGVGQQAIQGQTFLRLLGQAAPHKFLAVWKKDGVLTTVSLYTTVAMVVYVCSSAACLSGCLTWR